MAVNASTDTTTETTALLARQLLSQPIERGGAYWWRSPGYKTNIENWNDLAKENEIHAAVSARNEVAEQKKSQPNVEFIMANTAPGTRILDLGCGYGRMAKYLLPRMTFEAYVGVDSSLVMLQKFQERYKENAQEQRTPIFLVHGDIDRIPVRDHSIDTCIVSAVFLHNHKDVTRKSIAEISRVLKPGGTLLVIGSFPNAYSLTGLQGWAFLTYLRLIRQEKKNGPVRYFSPREIRRLLKGFRSVTLYPNGFSLYPKTVLGMPSFMKYPHRRLYDRLHGFLKRWVPHRIQDIFCTHYDAVAHV